MNSICQIKFLLFLHFLQIFLEIEKEIWPDTNLQIGVMQDFTPQYFYFCGDSSTQFVLQVWTIIDKIIWGVWCVSQPTSSAGKLKILCHSLFKLEYCRSLLHVPLVEALLQMKWFACRRSEHLHALFKQFFIKTKVMREENLSIWRISGLKEDYPLFR